jgi:antitoxin YefM
VAITLTAFRQNLYKFVKQVLEDETGSIPISTRSGEVVLVNAAELNSLREFHHLFSSPANAKALLESLERSRQGDYKVVTMAELRALAESK